MRTTAVIALLCLLSTTPTVFAQPPLSTTPASVPTLVRFSGTLATAEATVLATFALHADASGGEPLWTETQAVAVGAEGRYAVLLGATLADGIPRELFAAGAARWVEVRVHGREPLPRVLLTSVPYALKASDADTIGGRPLSAFVLAGDKTGMGADGLTYVDARTLSNGLATANGAAPGGAGSANYIGLFIDSTSLGNSVVYQTPTGSIGVNTTTPLAGFHAVSNASPTAYFDVYSNSLGALPVVCRAARGTPASPTAVQANDILGGLAVRGYGATGFSTGRGQVMFKAAENWTDAAQGTYLQFTTTPLGGTGWQERMRVAPDGKVGIGTSTPAQALSVAGTIESTTGGFRFPDGTSQTTAAVSNVSLYNSAFGYQSLAANTTGGNNSALGYHVLTANTTGGSNTAMGSEALAANTTASGNSAFGYRAMWKNTTGYYNSAFGLGSLLANTTGMRNSGFGTSSLASAIAGNDNSAFGYGSLALTTGDANSAFGSSALVANTSASGNSAFGYLALAANTTGSVNTAVGSSALAANTTGNSNTAVGSYALRDNTTGYQNTATGVGSLEANTTGTGNSAFGDGALRTLTTDNLNSAFGFNSMRGIVSGRHNSAFGAESMANSTGAYNSAFGTYALNDNAGDRNTGLGYSSLAESAGSNNSAVGYMALHYNETGALNAAVGSEALRDNLAGARNAALGVEAGIHARGSDNTFLGYQTGPDFGYVAVSNVTAIGARATVTESNTIVLGAANGSGHETDVGIGTSSPYAKLQVVGNIRVGTSGTLGCVQRYDGAAIAGTCSSDARLKTDIRPVGSVLGKVAQLQPVRYRWRAREFPDRHFGDSINLGLIAQDVEQVFPELVSSDEHGYKMVNYSELPYLTLQAVKELNAKANALEAQNTKKDEQIRKLTEQVEALTRAVAALGDKRQ